MSHGRRGRVRSAILLGESARAGEEPIRFRVSSNLSAPPGTIHGPCHRSTAPPGKALDASLVPITSTSAPYSPAKRDNLLLEELLEQFCNLFSRVVPHWGHISLVPSDANAVLAALSCSSTSASSSFLLGFIVAATGSSSVRHHVARDGRGGDGGGHGRVGGGVEVGERVCEGLKVQV